MHRFSDRAGSADGSRERRQRCCLRPWDSVRGPIQPISRLNNPAYVYPAVTGWLRPGAVS
jgi:hypothetical protein